MSTGSDLVVGPAGGDVVSGPRTIIEAVAAQVFIPLTVGGGVRTVDDVRRLLAN